MIKQIGQLEEGIVGGVRNLAERQDVVDPRAFTYGTRIGLAFAGDKGIRKVVQTGKKVAAIAKAEQIMKSYQNPALKGVLMQSIDPSTGIKIGLPSPDRAADYLRRVNTDFQFKSKRHF